MSRALVYRSIYTAGRSLSFHLVCRLNRVHKLNPTRGDMTSIVSVITTISVVVLFLIRVNATEKMILHLGVLISQEGELDLSGYIPSMNLALETIKNDTTLPFDFHITLNDSKVSETV